MSHVFHADVHDRSRVPDSWWRVGCDLPEAPLLQGNETAEVAIIGGGYAGLSTALHLVRDHGISATVLEAGPPGWGASGRNGGFVTYPSTKLTAAEMARKYGLEETRRFYASGRDSVDLVRALLADEAIEADLQGDCVYEVAHAPDVVAELQASVADYAHLGVESRFLSREAFLEVGHGGREQFGAVRLEGCFGLHPLKFALGLERAARRQGAKVFAGSKVADWRRDGALHLLRTETGTIRARHVVVAANGYLENGLHARLDNRTIPALSNIIVTEPLSEAQLRAESYVTESPANNVRNLLFYYRLLPVRRFLFGARGGTWGDAAEDAVMKAWLVRRLGEVFPAFAAARIDHFWNGLVAITPRKTPVIARVPEDLTVHVAYGCHGNGVALQPWAGKMIARSIAGVAPIEALPAPYRGLSANLLAPFVRRWGLKAAYAWYGWRERQ